MAKVTGVSKRRLKNGKVRWRYFGSFKGKKFYSSAKYLSEAEALLARRQHLERLAAMGSTDMKLRDVIRERIESIELNHTRNHANQTEAYLQKAVDAWGDDISIYNINRDMVQKLLNDEARRLKVEGKNNYRVNGLRTALHALFSFVIDRYELYDFRNPVSRVKRFSIETKVKHIPEQWEIDLVTDNLNDKQRKLFLFVLQTGCRIGEALRLRVKDLDFDKRLVTLWSRKSKGSNLVYRRVPMPLIMDDIKSELSVNQNKRVFKHWTKTPTFIDLTIQEINDREKRGNLEKLSKGHWKPITRFNWHNLRHRATSLWLNDNMAIYEVMARLGHNNVKTTMRYSQLLKFTNFTLMEGEEVDSWDF